MQLQLTGCPLPAECCLPTAADFGTSLNGVRVTAVVCGLTCADDVKLPRFGGHAIRPS
jgi:hypothetical protein